MGQITATSNAQHYPKMLCTMITKPPSTSKFYVDFKIIFFQRSQIWHTFFLQIFCRFTARERAKLLFVAMCFDSYYSKAQRPKYCRKRAFVGEAKSWKVTLDRFPWFGRHVENLGDVIMYPVLARTGEKRESEEEEKRRGEKSKSCTLFL